MKIYCTFSKTYGIMLCLLLLISFSLLSVATLSNEKTTLDSEGKRSAYLSSMGYGSASPLGSSQIVIPLQFEKEYETYNGIVKKAGFDLSHYKGKTAELYTYSFGDSIIHLLCFDGQLICADLCNLNEKSIYPLKASKNG